MTAALFGFSGGNTSTHIPMVAPYTNVYLIAAFPSVDLTPVVQAVGQAGMNPVVALGPIVQSSSTGKRLTNWSARLDRWKAAQSSTDGIFAFYLPDEPYHNGWTGTQLKAVSARVKVLWPSKAQWLIDAYTVVRLLGTSTKPIPTAVTMVGWDRYATLDPDTDPEYNADYSALVSHAGGRGIILVGESQWIQYYTVAGYTPDAMGPIFDGYRKVAQRPNVSVLMMYAWANDFEYPGYIGAEGLPQAVRDKYVTGGKTITGKP